MGGPDGWLRWVAQTVDQAVDQAANQTVNEAVKWTVNEAVKNIFSEAVKEQQKMRAKVQCARCRREFVPHRHQKFCGDYCRRTASFERQDEASRKLWNSAGPVPVPAEIAALNDRERVQTLIGQHAPPDAYGYRLGAPNTYTDEDEQYLRWFPGPEHEWPAYFTLKPWQAPRVPEPGGIFLVAYFKDDGSLLGEPAFKLLIPWGQRSIKWSRGDRKLPLDKQRCW